jgi:hypothetical protein
MQGSPAKEIVATKPAGAYALRPGVNGVFLLDDNATILGRYGPDTYSPDEVARALSAATP